MDKSDSMSDDAIERRLTAIGGPGYAEGVARLSLVVGLVAFLAAAVRGDERTAEALRHFQAGTRLYSQGRFPEALVEFAAANKLKPNAALLYDLGQTHRALGHAQEALSYFRAYVDAAPFAANHDEVVAKIQVVETDLRQRNQEQANVATRLSAAEAAQRTADELSLRARNLMAEAEEAKSAAHDAQARAQRVLSQYRPTPIYKRWYLWTSVALLVAGGVTASVVLTRPSTPSTTQGNFDF